MGGGAGGVWRPAAAHAPYGTPVGQRASRMNEPSLDDLNQELAAIPPVSYPLEETPEAAFEHSVRMGQVAAICCEAFRRRGLHAVLVGGGVIEFVLPGAYTTPDIDLVVSRRSLQPPRPLVDAVFRDIGFSPNGARHWVRDGWFVEVPDWDITDPTTTVVVNGHELQMVLPEVVLIGRLVEFDQTGHTGHATQALLMLTVLDDIDEAALARLAAQERVEDFLAFFRELAASPQRPTIDDAFLRSKRDEILQERQRVAAERRAQREGGGQGAGTAG